MRVFVALHGYERYARDPRSLINSNRAVITQVIEDGKLVSLMQTRYRLAKAAVDDYLFCSISGNPIFVGVYSVGQYNKTNSSVYHLSVKHCAQA